MPTTPAPVAPRDASRTPFMQRLRGAVLLVAVNATIFLAVDWVLVKLDLLSPPLPYGLSDLGFGYPGVRTSATFGAARATNVGGRLTVAMVGDSHSQLRFDNPLDSHEFVLEGSLRAEGLPVDVISAGRGRYSPLQEYLLFKLNLRDAYRPRILLMNFYSGNDFYDMLRPDDRPHFARDAGSAIVMRDPVWVSFVNPSERSWIERSRLLWAADEVSSRLGFPRVATRLRMFTATVNRSDRPLGDTLQYLSALRKSQEPRIGYPAAFAAQVLNQALFFQHFPDSKPESLAFMRALLQRAKTENPDALLVLSSIPSAAIMGAVPRDVGHLWEDTLARTGLTDEWVAGLENTLVDGLRTTSATSGWFFIDLRDCLRARRTGEELYSAYDLHISAAASRRIGRCQAEALLGNEQFRSLVRVQPASASRQGT